MHTSQKLGNFFDVFISEYIVLFLYFVGANLSFILKSLFNPYGMGGVVIFLSHHMAKDSSFSRFHCHLLYQYSLNREMRYIKYAFWPSLILSFKWSHSKVSRCCSYLDTVCWMGVIFVDIWWPSHCVCFFLNFGSLWLYTNMFHMFSGSPLNPSKLIFQNYISL